MNTPQPAAASLTEAVERWNRDCWQPLERGLVDLATALGRSLSVDFTDWQIDLLANILGLDLDRHRIAMTLPRLHLRQVMVHGLVPYVSEGRDEHRP
ncbi:hypothetical protein [Nocardiopsis dassonvillei]|uniref:hypothetical protein n=1 Tax=Nocardiopsis dassonvillei TaxID=2014 RepID=UPI003644BFA7